MGRFVIGVSMAGHQLDPFLGKLHQAGIHGIGGGSEGLVHIAHHRAQRTQNHVVGVEIVGVHGVVNHRGVLLIGEEHHHQIVLRINHREGAGPALVADGVTRSMGGKVVHPANLSLPPPSQTPGGVAQALGLGKFVYGILGEELMTAVAAGEHHRGQPRQILCIGEQACMTGDAAHGVIGLLIVDLAPDGVCPDVLEGNGAVPGVALELSCGAILFLEAVLQGVVGHMGQAHGVPEGLLQEGIQPFARHLLHDKAQKHVVHIRVDCLAAWLIGQRRGQNHLQSFLPVLGEQGVAHALLGLLGDLVKLVIVILRVRIKAGLMHQDVPNGELGLPRQDLSLHFLRGPVLENGGSLIVKLRIEIRDASIQADLAPVHQVLQRIVHRVHLGIGGQVIQGVRRHRYIVLVTWLNPGSVGTIAVGGAPGFIDHQLAIFDHGQLSAGEAVFHFSADEIADELHGAGIHPHLRRVPVYDHRIWNMYRHSACQLAGGDPRHLDGIGSVQGYIGNVQLPGATRQHGGRIHLYVIDKHPETGHPFGDSHVQLTLARKASEAKEIVHHQGVIHIAAPVREGHHRLPLSLWKRRLRHMALRQSLIGRIRPPRCQGRHSRRYGHHGRQGQPQHITKHSFLHPEDSLLYACSCIPCKFLKEL